jgi:hypothetical protein
MRWNDVQLMLYGENLHGITARFEGDGLLVAAVHTLVHPSYAFVDVHIPRGAPPGEYVLEVRRGDEIVRVPYRLFAREQGEGRHRGFSSDDVVYLITPDRFANGDTTNDRTFVDEFDPADPRRRHGGDLAGIIRHLDYLLDLGITAVWLNPVLENSGRNSYHGYAATDLYRIDPRLGSNDDYRRMVEEAHRRGIKVIFDHVSNHMASGIHGSRTCRRPPGSTAPWTTTFRAGITHEQ